MSRLQVERILSRAAFEEFAALPLQVYADRDAWWAPDVASEIDLLSGRTRVASYIELMPMWVRRDGRPVARVSAVVNRRYNEHWHEKLGQLIHFEALAGEEEAAVALLGEAVDWLRGRGMRAARSGFAAFLDYPYAIDSYGSLPAFLLRGNPDYYHRCFKNAGFSTEKGLSDYTAALTPELLERYRTMVASAEQGGVAIRSWREYGFADAVDTWTEVINAAFARHWGWNPVTREEVRPMLMSFRGTPVADLSMIAVEGSRPVGTAFSTPDMSPALARVRPGYRLPPERGGGTRGALINIGVLEGWRGRGVGLKMAARSFLTMAEQGMRFAGYTLVVDDNWASRATAGKLGARVTSNFVAYRREL